MFTVKSFKVSMVLRLQIVLMQIRTTLMLWMNGKFWRAYKIRMGSMTEGDEFEPDELQGGLAFSEDEDMRRKMIGSIEYSSLLVSGQYICPSLYGCTAWTGSAHGIF
jgi:hypothetical protein